MPHRPDFIYGLTTGDIVYDIETYPNIFTVGFEHCSTGQRWLFEISFRKNEIVTLCQFLNQLKAQQCRMVGYNNLGFDYPVVHFIYKNQSAGINVSEIYQKAMSIINASPNAKFAHLVWDDQHVATQIDLFKIHHFDNRARSTSLKMLEFNMRMDNIEDLPFPVGTTLTDQQADILIDYMWHDIFATRKFYNETLDHIRFREELSLKYNRNFLNHNDTKIGKDFFIMKLEEVQPGCCYQYVEGKRKMVQTQRENIDLNHVILPYVTFDHPEFQRILTWFKAQVITETKGVFKDVNCEIDGFKFDFGTGGIHGSVESQIVYSDDYWIIEDWDVASYYPNLAIANGLHPNHLGQTFCTIYKDVYEQRKSYPKGTAENAMLKLALNGVYGDSNNQYSPFYDPQYTMSITINGQLLLCVLAEQLIKLDVLKMVQINTDGLTIRYPRHHQQWVHSVCQWWEQLTNLTLESAEYNRMFIRDVNNYIAEYSTGGLKRKGAYEYELGWHQNHSALVVPKAAEAALVRGENIREFIESHNDIFDFFLRTKVPRNSILEWGGEQVSNIVRYYISKNGKPLEKVMPPVGPAGEYKRANNLTNDYFNSVIAEIGTGVWDERIHTKNKSVYEERRTSINTGWTVELCNKLLIENFEGVDFITSIDKADINMEWYIKEAEKLVNPLLD